MLLEWENNSRKLQIISRKLQITNGKFQNNAINDVKQISLSHMIKKWNIALKWIKWNEAEDVNFSYNGL